MSLSVYQNTHTALKGVPLGDAWDLSSMLDTPVYSMARTVLEECPIVRAMPLQVTTKPCSNLAMQVYYSLNAAAGRAPFHFAVMTSMESTMSTVRWRCKTLFGRGDGSLSEVMSRIKDMYMSFEVVEDPTERGLPYPNEETCHPGMSVELRYALDPRVSCGG
jgi:hypothetical protein